MDTITATINAQVGYQIVSETATPDPYDGPATLTVSAPAGMRVVSGGYGDISANVTVSKSAPAEDGSSWSMTFSFNNPDAETLSVWAVCLAAN